MSVRVSSVPQCLTSSVLAINHMTMAMLEFIISVLHSCDPYYKGFLAHKPQIHLLYIQIMEGYFLYLKKV